MKRVAFYALIVIALIALAVILSRISDVIAVTFSGVVGAVVLRTFALPLSRWLRISERWGLAIVIVGGLVVVGLLGWLFGNQVAAQAAEMQRILPESAQKIRDWLESSTAGKTLVDSLKNTAGDSKTIQNVGSAAGSVMTAVAAVVLVFFLSVYFSLDPREYLEGALRVFPPASRLRVRLALENAGEALRKWLIAQLVAMVIVGVLVGVSLALLGVPLALLLGTLAALLEFIPVVGPVLFTIPGLLVAFTKGPAVALYALLAYLVVQQLESNVIIPLLQRWALRLPPVISLLSVLVVGLLFGPMGVIIATPMAVVVVELVKRLYVEDTIEQPPRKDDALPSAGETVTRRA